MKCIETVQFIFLMLPLLITSQEKKKDTILEKLARPAFETSYIIDNPTNVLYGKNSMEMQINHRFGLVNSGNNDMLGIWAPGNMRLGLSYSFFDRITMGFGTTKNNRLQDSNIKLGLFRQTRSGKIPVSVSYFGNFVIDARKKEYFKYDQDRFSFFHQIIIARRFGPDLSLQVAPSVSHYNLVANGLDNDVFGLAVGGRYKLSPQTSILVDYSHPFTNYPKSDSTDPNPKPGFSIGTEFSTMGHAFQVFFSSYAGIVPQQNYVFNQNEFFKGDFLIGFNITRIFKF